MPILNKNINIKGSAFPPKCNIYPYSNLLNKRFMHNNVNIIIEVAQNNIVQDHFHDAMLELGILPNSENVNVEPVLGIDIENLNSQISFSWDIFWIFGVTASLGLLTYWVVVENNLFTFLTETVTGLYYDGSPTICEVLDCSSIGALTGSFIFFSPVCKLNLLNKWNFSSVSDEKLNFFNKNDFEIFKFYLIEKNYQLLWNKTPVRFIKMILCGTLNFNHVNFLMLKFMLEKFKKLSQSPLETAVIDGVSKDQLSALSELLQNSVIKVQHLERILVLKFSKKKIKKLINNIPVTILLTIYTNYLETKKFPSWFLIIIKNI